MKKIRFWGSGALNVDYFFEVEDLQAINFRGRPLKAGSEVWGTREEFEALREELLRHGKLLTRSGGGSAANTIYALKSWGFECGFLGIVGKDEEGDFALAELSGIDLSGVLRRGHTSRSLIILDTSRDRAIFVCPHSEEEALASFQPQVKTDGWLHLSSFITEEGFVFQQRLVKEHRGALSLDPGEIYAARGLSALKALFERAEILFLTHQELTMLKTSPEGLLALGGRRIYLKKGARGAEVWGDKGSFPISPAAPEKIIDNTGAGDVFDAGVLAGLALGLSPEASGHLAARLSASSLRDYGRLGFPKREEFETILHKIKNE